MVKIIRLHWRLFSAKRDTCWGHLWVQFVKLEEPWLRLSPTMSLGGTGGSPPLACGVRGVDIPKPDPSTSWRTSPPDIVCHPKSVPETQVTPGLGRDGVSSSPAQMGITSPWGGAGHGCCDLTANKEKKNPTNLQKLSCVWSGASNLRPLLDAGEVMSGSRALF